MEPGPYPTPKKLFIASTLLGGLVMGVVGTMITLSLLADSPKLRQFLGVPNPDGTVTTRQDRLVLEESSAVITTVEKVSPAVVSILTTRNVRSFFGDVIEQKGGGTGFIITHDGLILTNRHVVADSRAEYTVLTSDGKDYSAKVVATDPSPGVDLAIVKIEATGLPVVELGSSDDLKIGQFVVAIGNALAEFQNTVTLGVVSAKDRQITAGGADGAERLEGLIQTDAAINPGNSGGPLVNLRGQVVGINTAVSAEAQNIGFAIPINLAKTAIESYQNNGKIVRPFLGIRYLPITKEIAELENLPVDRGALIIRGEGPGQLPVVPGSPAETAGLEEGDIIVEINKEEITELRSLARILQRYKVGDAIELVYLHAGEKKTVTVTLEELKS